MEHMTEFAERISTLKAEGAYAVLAQAQALEAQGRDIIHLEIGEPDFSTLSHVSLGGIGAIAEGRTKYNPPSGLLDLKKCLAEDAGQRRGISFKPEQVTVAPGAKPILFLALLALLEPGDEVICPDPGFPSYEAAVRVAGGKPVFVPLDEKSGFDLDLEAFENALSDRTRVIILNSPGNPTGGVLSGKTLEAVAEAARARNGWVMSDEIYGGLVYEDAAPSIVTLPGMAERTIIVDGFSKTYAMTGWRLGYGIMPEALAAKMGLLLTHSVGCTATFTQLAGIKALTGPQHDVLAMRDTFRDRRDKMVEGLNRIPGFRCHLPKGAFYAFPNVEACGRSAEALAGYLLDAAGVALLPGTAFGPNGKGHLRLSYANSLDNIEIAVDRIAEAVKRLG